MTAIVDAFAADYFVRERLSDGRRLFVLRALTMFEAHAGEPLEQLTAQHLQAFLGSLVGAGYHVNYVRKFNHAIKPFYKWAWETRRIDADHFMRIRDVSNPRGATGQAKPRPYKRTEIARMWEELDTQLPLAEPRFIARWQRGTSPYRRVWRHAMHLQIEAAACLALFGGLRQGEIYSLPIVDMHPDNDYIVVRGKTVVHADPKIREVPYTAYGRERVARWLAFRELLAPAHDSPWLVIDPRATMTGSEPLNPISDRGFGRLMSRIGPGWEFHRLRHTCATEWLRGNLELEKVSKMLGHATIAQTLNYADVDRDDVRRGMRQHEDSIVGALGRVA